MKIVWFSPTTRQSAIGRMTSLVIRQLRKSGHSVTIVQTEGSDRRNQEGHDLGTAPIYWGDFAAVRAAVALADIVYYQIGDNYEFHEGCLHWMPQVPGVVCLHDFCLSGLFLDWGRRRKSEAYAIVRSLYGESVAKTFRSAYVYEKFRENSFKVSPMTEWICAMALGVITHSSWGCDRVLNSCAGPVDIVPLPFEIPGGDGENGLGENRGPLRVLTVGYVNPNKRAESVIRAIGTKAKLRNNIVYKIIGRVGEKRAQTLSELARSCGVNLVVAGEVDDEVLSKAYKESDVIIGLRWPTFEAASGSAIEAMLYGRALLCTNAGFYSEIPDDCVFKISVKNEIADVADALSVLIERRDLIASVGKKARAWAKSTFEVSQYARSVVEMAELAIRAKPVVDACRWLSSVAHVWYGHDGNGISETDASRLEILSDTSGIGEGKKRGG